MNDFLLFKFGHKIQTAEIPERTPFLKLVNRNSNKIQLEISFNAKIMNLYKILSLTDLRTEQQQKTPFAFVKCQNNKQTNVSFSKRCLLSLGMKNNNTNISVWRVPGTILCSSPEYFSVQLYLQY